MSTTSVTIQTARPAKTVALFVSDLHLKADMPNTVAAFLDFLNQHATQTERLYLLGDIFEYWAGDDDMSSPFLQQIVQALRQVSDVGVKLFWLAGNRDFLVGQAFAAATGATLLSDPYVFDYAAKRYVITHGDQLCTDDIAYQRFRAQVRQPEWQAAFLARPLEERKSIIASVRKQSQLHQQEQIEQHSEMIMDVNSEAVTNLFSTSGAHRMIHGHTHRPANHQHGENTRYVLSDWDCESEHGKPRGDWLALLENGEIQRFKQDSQPL